MEHARTKVFKQCQYPECEVPCSRKWCKPHSADVKEEQERKRHRRKTYERME